MRCDMSSRLPFSPAWALGPALLVTRYKMKIGEAGAARRLGIISVGRHRDLDYVAGLSGKCLVEIGGHVCPLRDPLTDLGFTGLRDDQLLPVRVRTSHPRPDRIAIVPDVSEGCVRQVLAKHAAADRELHFREAVER